MVDDARTSPCRRLTALLAIGSLLLASCSSSPDPLDETGPASGAYAVIIDWFVDRDSGLSEDPLVFVTALGLGTSIGLETQAEVVAATEESADVRFVDDRSEAFEDGEVREGAMFLALGPVVRTGRRATIESDEIMSPQAQVHWTFELRFGEKTWTIVGDPNPTT
jgi:hypothetical protein